MTNFSLCIIFFLGAIFGCCLCGIAYLINTMLHPPDFKFDESIGDKVSKKEKENV